MNPYTGELINGKALDELEHEQQEKFRKLSEDLEETAQEILDGQDRVTINLKSNSSLAKWAKQERRNDKKENKNKKKRKQSRNSRKRNRK